VIKSSAVNQVNKENIVDSASLQLENMFIDQSKIVELNTFNNEKIIVDLNSCTQPEYELFDKLRALLIGEEIYKKFGSSS
jgi:hypothetical protein